MLLMFRMFVYCKSPCLSYFWSWLIQMLKNIFVLVNALNNSTSEAILDSYKNIRSNISHCFSNAFFHIFPSCWGSGKYTFSWHNSIKRNLMVSDQKILQAILVYSYLSRSIGLRITAAVNFSHWVLWWGSWTTFDFRCVKYFSKKVAFHF